MTETDSPTEPEAAERPGRREFIVLVSAMMALTALAIDMMLPAFDEMRAEFGLAEDSTAVAGIVTAFLLGLAGAQLFWGPVSDRFGRRPVLYAGLGLYALAAAGSALAPTLPLLLVSRVVWGIGAAGTRVVAVAFVRDRYEGQAMARTMSFVMAVFILVPVAAPAVGAAILAVGPYQWVFWACGLAAAAVSAWAVRMPETLHPEHRRALSWGAFGDALARIATTRSTAGYTIAMTLMTGAFLSYLASSELMVDDVFDRGDQFPLIFGTVAAVIGVFSLVNARIVGRLGVARTTRLGLNGYVIGSAVLLAIAVAAGGRPEFWVFYPVLGLTLGFHVMLIPNMNAAAMAPQGAIAGTAAAVIGSITMGGGALIGAVIDRQMGERVTPLVLGMLVLGVAAWLLVAWVERPAPAVDSGDDGAPVSDPRSNAR